MRSITTVTVLSMVLSCLVGVASAEEQVCAWQSDVIHFPPAVNPVNDTGTISTDSSGCPFCDTHVWRFEYWKVVIQPGYMFAYANCWEDVTIHLGTGKADISKADSRTSYYNVVGTTDCMSSPPHAVTATANNHFKVMVDVDHPALAEISGISTVEGTQTGLWAQAAVALAAAEPDSQTATFSVQKGGASVEVEVTWSYGEDYAEDTADGNDSKSAVAYDEEYIIYTKSKMDSEADASLLNLYASSRTKLWEHYVYIQTQCSCANCEGSLVDQLVVNKDTYSVNE